MKKRQLIDYDVTCVIMGGGAGTRLFPLTLMRAKPAVPLGGKFRLIDIPISNCINSGVIRVFILTQFNSTPLHRHISQSYHFDRFSRGFVEILAAQQSPQYRVERSWYEGTADAVRKNLARFRESGGTEVLILSGDQIYQMDLREILETHRGSHGGAAADVTIGTVLLPRDETRQLGVLRTDDNGRVEAFVEKPGKNEDLYTGLEAAPELLDRFGIERGDEPLYMANMGMYVFGIDTLEKALDNAFTDFGGEVLPSLLRDFDVRAHLFQGYWEDIGTLKSFHQANLDLANEKSKFNFYDQLRPIYTRARQVPAARLDDVHARESLISDGCLIRDATIEHSLIGLRAVIGSGCTLRRTYMMGADFYEDDDDRARNRAKGVPDVGVGEGSIVENAIIDKDARIGKNVRIINAQGYNEYSDGIIVIRDGISVVMRNQVVPDGYEI